VELKVVRYEVDDGVALVTLDRPQRLNAWTGRMHTEYRWVLAEAERDDAVRAIVVTGAGRAFCAGADSSALDGHVERGGYDAGVDTETLARPGHGVRAEFDHAFAFHYGIPKPVIAAVNGAAAGVGLVLACYCDLRFASSDAKFTTSSARLGLPAEYGLSWVLPRLVGIGHAADLLLSSRIVLGEEAARIGLVNRAMAADQVLPAALDYARTIAHEISPSSVRESKRQLYTDLHRDVGRAVEESEQLLERMAAEPDFREGVRALLEKRPPRF
jgi:enoyl-CoA hydratase/carnithine racemase